MLRQAQREVRQIQCEDVVMWFEDVPLGEKITLGSYTFTEENIIAFAKKYDPQPFHIDKEAALRSPYGGLIASGWHTALIWMKRMIAYRHPRVAAGAGHKQPKNISPRPPRCEMA